MAELTMGVNWVAVVVGAVAAFIVGWLWYSETLFGKKWKEGIGTPAVPGRSMMPGMLTQAVGTFLLAWVIGITATTNSLSFAILIALAIGALIKAGGFYGGKTKYAIAVESGYVLVMVVVMILAHAIF